MDIKRILLIVLFFCIVFIFNSCSSNNHDEPLGICHFSNVEMAVPLEYTGMGNTTMFFTSNNHEGIFLIIGETLEFEEDVAKNLALFESTKFYEKKISFKYDENDSDNKVSGSLYNERFDKEYHFEGYIIQNPELYIFCMCEYESDNDYIKELVNNVYSSIDILDK